MPGYRAPCRRRSTAYFEYGDVADRVASDRGGIGESPAAYSARQEFDGTGIAVGDEQCCEKVGRERRKPDRLFRFWETVRGRAAKRKGG